MGAVQMTTYRERGYQRVMHEDVVTLLDENTTNTIPDFFRTLETMTNLQRCLMTQPRPLLQLDRAPSQPQLRQLPLQLA